LVELSCQYQYQYHFDHINMDPPECQKNLRAYPALPENASYRPPSSTRNGKSPSAAASRAVDKKYTLGDPALPADVDIFRSAEERVAAVEQLKEGDYCFILRSDFRFTYARVLKQEIGMLRLQVNERGCTKSVAKHHWTRYVRTLFTGFPKNQLPRGKRRDERWHDREQLSEQKVPTRHRRVTVCCGERPSPSLYSRPTNGFMRSMSRRSLPNQETSNQNKHSLHLYKSKRSQSGIDHLNHERSQSSASGSDDSSSARGVDCHAQLRKFSLATNYSKRSSSSAGSHDLKGSAPTQEAAPLKKCCKQGHQERSQSESGQYIRYQVPPSGSDDSSVSSLDSFTDSDDSSLQEDVNVNNLLTKSMSMPSMKHAKAKEGHNLRYGAFGDVKRIEVLD
jgi:hypothetical protein